MELPPHCKLKYAKRVDLKCFHQKRKINHCVRWQMCSLTRLWWSFHNVYVYQVITLYALNINSFICQLHLREAGEKTFFQKERDDTLNMNTPGALSYPVSWCLRSLMLAYCLCWRRCHRRKGKDKTTHSSFSSLSFLTHPWNGGRVLAECTRIKKWNKSGWVSFVQVPTLRVQTKHLSR